MNKPRNTWIVLLILVSLLAASSPPSLADDSTASLSGHWASAEFGPLDFVQNGNSFTGFWTVVAVSGTITGNSASFTYWQGNSFASCNKDMKGHGSFVVSDNGASLEGSWTNMAEGKDKESGSFSATKVLGMTSDLPANSEKLDTMLKEDLDQLNNRIEVKFDTPSSNIGYSQTYMVPGRFTENKKPGSYTVLAYYSIPNDLKVLDSKWNRYTFEKEYTDPVTGKTVMQKEELWMQPADYWIMKEEQWKSEKELRDMDPVILEMTLENERDYLQSMKNMLENTATENLHDNDREMMINEINSSISNIDAEIRSSAEERSETIHEEIMENLEPE